MKIFKNTCSNHTLYVFFLIVNDGKTGTEMSDEKCDNQTAERHSLINAGNDKLEDRANMISQSENYSTAVDIKGKNVNSVKCGNCFPLDRG